MRVYINMKSLEEYALKGLGYSVICGLCKYGYFFLPFIYLRFLLFSYAHLLRL